MRSVVCIDLGESVPLHNTLILLYMCNKRYDHFEVLHNYPMLHTNISRDAYK
jgi:hypothetical protein